MTQVDFYILKEGASGDRYQLACRIAEKAYRQGRRVLIQTCSNEEANHVDRLLWTYKQNSFIPHGLPEKVDRSITPILVNPKPDPGDEHDVLINLCQETPDFFSRFERVAELIDHDPQVKLAGRQRYRFYRDRGYQLNSHDIG